MTPQQIITEARFILLDTDPLNYRQSDAELLGYVNSGLKEAAVLAPNLFETVGDLTCTAYATEQAVSFADAQRFVRVLRIKNGTAVRECDMDTLDRFMPTWPSDTEAAAINWMSASNADPRRFYIYPKAPLGQVLEVVYVKVPSDYAIGDTITELPNTAQPALVSYVVARSESKDDEHVNSGRAIAFMGLFKSFFSPTAAPQ